MLTKMAERVTCVTGVISWLPVYPIDVLKSRIQAAQDPNQYKGPHPPPPPCPYTPFARLTHLSQVAQLTQPFREVTPQAPQAPQA